MSFQTFFQQKIFSKRDVQHKKFLKDLGLLIIKNHFPMQFVESPWLKWFSLHLCPRVVLLSKRQFSQEFMHGLVEKTK